VGAASGFHRGSGGKAPSRLRQGVLEALGDFCNFSVKTIHFYAYFEVQAL